MTHYLTQPTVKGGGIQWSQQPYHDGSSGFDIDSIMMYESFAGSKPPKAVKYTQGEAVLLRLEMDIYGNGRIAADWEIKAPKNVPHRDAVFIRRIYP